MGIYVEIPIRASMDELWEKTQNPQLHQRWDLRFTQIECLPRQGKEPQRFLYRTRIGFGLKIDGQGESTGERDGDSGARSSSLKFWSEDPKSLIKTGSGYWKYVPESGGLRADEGARATRAVSTDFPFLGMLPSFVSEFACLWLFRKFQLRDKAAFAIFGSPPDSFSAVGSGGELELEEDEEAETENY